MEVKQVEEETPIIEENCYGEEYTTLPIEAKVGTRNEDRGNFLAISETCFLSYGGYSFAVNDLRNNKKQVFYSRDGGGIGAVAVHPSKNYFAVAEKGAKPNIYIYKLPDLNVVSTLAGGTERGYCSVSFSKLSGKFLSIGTHPDFSIVVWDWTSGKPLLKAKAFSQEIYKAAFSDFSEDVICSAGMAHIKFWKIANTFTGLKLKGEIGKFGATELSDIHDFVHLSDGNVVSGSESGELLLWEGNFIKSVIRQSADQPCHSGNINCLKLYKERMIFTASELDHVIKVWSGYDFRNLGNEGNLCNYFLPVREFSLPEGSGVVSIDISLIHLGLIFAQEKRGGLFRIQISEPSDDIELVNLVQYTPVVTKILGFPSDAILAMDYVAGNLLFTGKDGLFKSMDSEVKSVSFWEIDRHRVTALSLNSQKTTVIIGNEAGLIKTYALKDMALKTYLKVFEDAVIAIRVHGNNVVAVSNRQLFVLTIDLKGDLRPHFLYENSDSDITTSLFLSGVFLFGTSAGDVRAFRVPAEGFHSNSENYLVESLPEEYEGKLHMTEFQKPKQDEDDIRYYLNDEMEFQDVEWEPQAIRGLAVFGHESSLAKANSIPKVIVSAEGNFVGYLYVLEMRQRVRPVADRVQEQLKALPEGESFAVNPVAVAPPEKEDPKDKKVEIVRPARAFKTRPKMVTFLSFEHDRDFSFWGYADGLISVRVSKDLDREVARVRAFDHDYGEVRDVQSFGTLNLFALSRDSTLAILRLTPTLKPEAEKRVPEKSTEMKLSAYEGQGTRWLPAEDAMAAGYSLQKDKIQSLKDSLARTAKQQREEIVAKITELRRNFQFLKEENRKNPSEMRIPESDLDFDPTYSRELPERFEMEIEEVEKEMEYDLKVAKMKVDKLNRFFVKENTEFVFGVSKLRTPDTVESFRLKHMTNYMTTGLEQIAMMIENDKGTENEEQHNKVETNRVSNTKALLATLADLKKRIGEHKTKDPYLQMKQRIKEECADFDTIDRLRDHQKVISSEIEVIKRSDLGKRGVEDSAEVREAKSQFGDYVLKTSQNLKLDEKTRVDLAKLETHILLLEKFVFNTKENFNKNLYSLRSKKQQIIGQIEDANRELEQINAKMDEPKENLVYHFVETTEFPELKFRVREAEISEALAIKAAGDVKQDRPTPQNDLEFEVERLRHNTLARFPDIAGKIARQEGALIKAGYRPVGDHSVMVTKPVTQVELNVRSMYFEEVAKNQLLLVSQSAKAAQAELAKFSFEPRQKRRTNTDNPKLLALKNLEKLRLGHRKAHLLATLTQEIESFDKEIDKMTAEKRKVNYELKMAQMRVLELFREWLEIQVFEEEDQVMHKDLTEKKAQIKEWNEKKVANVFAEKEITVKMAKLEGELRVLEESYREKIFPSEPEKADFVFKYFSVNFRKNQNGGVSDETDEGAKDLDPNSLDPEKKECILYFEQNEEWVELLKKRYETDESLKALQKAKATMDADNNRIEERIRVIQKTLMETKAELDELQFKKLHRIHKLNCSFILDLDQVFLETPFQSLDSTVVFTTDQLKALKNRTTELEDECHKIETERSELYVSQDALVKNLNILRTCRKQAKEELDENFKLKFGQYVNLEILNSLKETKRLKELKKEYREVDKASNKRIEDAQHSLSRTQEELVDLKRKNTDILKRITWLGNAQIKLNKTLDNTNKQIFKDEKDLEGDHTRNNKKDLVGVIRLLNTELDALKGEIAALRQK